MNKYFLITFFALTACSPIKVPVSNQYSLEAFSGGKLKEHHTDRSILVSQPEAMAGYQTEQMHYIQKPFALESFAHNAWISSPANMLYPLITQSLQQTGYFHAVASGPYADKADFRLDTQLIALKQNFLVKPSVVELVVKVELTHIADNHLLASRIISEHVPCMTDTPYGGVIAANQAVKSFTAKVAMFTVKQIKHYQ